MKPEKYASHARHKELFDPEKLSEWFLPSFLGATSAWRASGDPRMLDLGKLPRVKLETSGVISFDCLRPELCEKLVDEVRQYHALGFPGRAPNSMNNYGLVLNEIGMKDTFTAVLQHHLLGIGARCFGGDEVRESTLLGQRLGGEDWGGDSLSKHHSFVVRYRPDEDRMLDMHVDECDVTFNFGLSDTGIFAGSDLVFCGMLGSADQRKHRHTYRHEQGRCIVHAGKRRHGALPISDGERCNLQGSHTVLQLPDLLDTSLRIYNRGTLQRLYSLQRIHKEVRPTSHIYLATPPATGAKAPTSDLLMRALFLSRVDKDSFSTSLTDSLDVALEEVEHAMLDPRVAKFGPSVTSRIFVHFVCELDMELEQLERSFTDTISSHVGHNSSEVIKLCIDEIEVKVHRRAGTVIETLRLSLSSLGGGFLKPKMLREIPDPVTGYPLRWEAAKEGAAISASDHPHVADQAELSRYQAKRVAARRAGSTYAFDLPGMLQLALTMKWIAATNSSGARRSSSPDARNEGRGARRRSPSPRSGRGAPTVPSKVPDTMPKDILTAVELVMDWSKMELVETTRAEGANDLGMLAWKLTMKTPEYPEGRVVILIANDVTFQAGSFGVREDQFFQKASELARKLGLPRVYVSCNSGARVGLVEELKPLYKVQWLDANDCSKGFDYLYLTKADYEKLPAGTVEAHKVSQGGEERYVLDAIIGEGQKSTQGGIGVENLQGSGLIAGETSRAYQETFTLSYITGRSVGIGAYLNRLGQRNIQMVSSPMILTGYAALNKLLGKNVYSSQERRCIRVRVRASTRSPPDISSSLARQPTTPLLHVVWY
ncbi:ACAC [Symbiodinium sp. CCMP2592]|nr:ACAC [Symbiodinium sp. CCMP2592]